jgi:hypothetical protein
MLASIYSQKRGGLAYEISPIDRESLYGKGVEFASSKFEDQERDAVPAPVASQHGLDGSLAPDV